MRNVLEVEFRSKVKFPTGPCGRGRNFERLLIDHPESPHKEHTLTWDDSAGLLIVRHKSGIECLVPRENCSYLRLSPEVAKKTP